MSMSAGGRERLCAYTVARALLEIVAAGRMAEEARRTGDRELLRRVAEDRLPRVEILLASANTVCPGIDPGALERARRALADAAKVLEWARRERRPEFVDRFLESLEEVERHLMESLAER